MSCSEVAAVCSMILRGMTVMALGVSTSGAVSLGDWTSELRLPSTLTPETSVAAAGPAVATGASASGVAAKAAGARDRPARPATAATPNALRAWLRTPATAGLKVFCMFGTPAGRRGSAALCRNCDAFLSGALPVCNDNHSQKCGNLIGCLIPGRGGLPPPLSTASGKLASTFAVRRCAQPASTQQQRN